MKNIRTSLTKRLLCIAVALLVPILSSCSLLTDSAISDNKEMAEFNNDTDSIIDEEQELVKEINIRSVEIDETGMYPLFETVNQLNEKGWS